MADETPPTDAAPLPPTEPVPDPTDVPSDDPSSVDAPSHLEPPGTEDAVSNPGSAPSADDAASQPTFDPGIGVVNPNADAAAAEEEPSGDSSTTPCAPPVRPVADPSFAMTQVALAQAVGMAMQNIVAHQQSMQIISTAIVAKALQSLAKNDPLQVLEEVRKLNHALNPAKSLHALAALVPDSQSSDGDAST